MKLYALQIRKSDLELIALLNNGVTPKVEKKKTFFIFDATWNSEFVPEIVTELGLMNTCAISNHNPLLLALKK